MAEATNPDQPATDQGIDAEALTLGRKVLGREPAPDEADAPSGRSSGPRHRLCPTASSGTWRITSWPSGPTRRSRNSSRARSSSIDRTTPRGTVALFRQRLAPGLQCEWHDGQAQEVDRRETHGRGADGHGVAEAAEEDRETPLHEGAGRRDEASDIVAETGPRGPQSSREELRQIDETRRRSRRRPNPSSGSIQ